MTLELTITGVVSVLGIVIAGLNGYRAIRRDQQVNTDRIMSRVRELEHAKIQTDGIMAEHSNLLHRVSLLEQQMARTDELMDIVRTHLPAISRRTR